MRELRLQAVGPWQDHGPGPPEGGLFLTPVPKTYCTCGVKAPRSQGRLHGQCRLWVPSLGATPVLLVLTSEPPAALVLSLRGCHEEQGVRHLNYFKTYTSVTHVKSCIPFSNGELLPNFHSKMHDIIFFPMRLLKRINGCCLLINLIYLFRTTWRV